MSHTKGRVLVVDDDPMLLSLLVDTLQTIGYEVVGALGGAQALDLLARSRFDLMVTDIKMPDIDGIQLLKMARHLYAGMPVLFITAYASPQMIGEAAPDGFLSKPFRIQHIEALIERTLARKAGSSGRFSRKVLVIDSDDDFRAHLTDALNNSQYIPFAAANESEALHQLETGEFDAIIADLTASGTTSGSLAELLHTRFPGTPLIVVGADDADTVENNQRLADFAGYIQKPFNLSSIIELLDKLTPSQS